jgi:hypothetical protein
VIRSAIHLFVISKLKHWNRRPLVLGQSGARLCCIPLRCLPWDAFLYSGSLLH